MRACICLILAAAFGLAPASNLVVNGGFEQDLSVGWTYQQSGYGSRTNERRPWSPPDTGNYCYQRQYGGPGFAKLYQLIDVAGPDLSFSFWASFGIGGGSSTCWPAASVFLEYYDHRGLWIGETRWYYHNQYCTWQPAPNRNLISIGDPAWMPYGLNVREEIEGNLPGVNADALRRVGVAIYSYTSDG